jgi:hypothetical protein
VLVTATVSAGCGASSSSDEQVFADAPTTVGTVSAALAKTDLLADVAKSREVLDGSGSTKAINSIYALINEAGNKKDVKNGVTMLRSGIPPLVGEFEADYQPTLHRLGALTFKTRAGERIRGFDIELMHEWYRVLPQLRTDLATSDSAWGAIQKFGARNDQMSHRLGRRLDALVAGLPASQRRVLEQALKQTYGK